MDLSPSELYCKLQELYFSLSTLESMPNMVEKALSFHPLKERAPQTLISTSENVPIYVSGPGNSHVFFESIEKETTSF
jgi:hypothetical protein